MRPFPRPHRAATSAPSTPCLVEPLEPRRLLAASPAPFPDDGGPDQASALYLGRLDEGRPSVRTAVGVVRPGEVQDVYRVKIDRPTDLTVNLAGLRRTARTKIYLMAFGETTATEAVLSRTDTTYRLTARVLPGSWYVGVFNGEGAGPGRDRGYALDASGTAAPAVPAPPVDAVLTRGAARSAYPLAGIETSTLNEPVELAGAVEGGVPAVYRVDVPRGGGTLRTSLDRPTGDVDLALFDAAGRRLRASNADGTSPEYVTLSVPAGSYFAHVQGRTAGRIDYRLRVSADLRPAPPVSAVLTRESARSAYAIPRPEAATLDGEVGGNVPAVYRIDLPRAGRLRVVTEPEGGDVDLALFDSAGRRLGTGANDGAAADAVAARLQPGSYYAHVAARTAARVGYALSTTIEFDAAAPPPAPPDDGGTRGPRGSTVVNGRLGSSDLRVFGGYPGEGAYADYYRFTADRDGTLRVDLRSDDIDAVVQVTKLDDVPGFPAATEGSNDDYSSDAGTDARLEFRATAGSTYLIRASSFAAGETGSYTLTVSPGTPRVDEVSDRDYLAEFGGDGVDPFEP